MPRASRPRPPTLQRVRWAGRWLRVPAFQRPQLASGVALRGPALIVEFSATTFVPPGWQAAVHRAGHLVLNSMRQNETTKTPRPTKDTRRRNVEFLAAPEVTSGIQG